MGQIQFLGSMARRPSKDELLYKAVLSGNIDAVNALATAGAHFEWVDHEGKTALIAACSNPNLYQVLNTLIALGANINAYRPGRSGGTPLHHAAKRGCVSAVKLLLSHGANALVMNDDCQTPLDVARMTGCTDVVRLIENHISYFSGWLREFYGPSLLGALVPQLLSKKIWVVVTPRGPAIPSKPVKLELAIYNSLEDSEPRTVISLRMSEIEKPKFIQQVMALRILDKSSGCRYKLGPGNGNGDDVDKSQMELFYNACLGVRQTIPTMDPITNSSFSSSQSTEDIELAMAIAASIQTASVTRPLNFHHSSTESDTNGWGDLPNIATYNGWGESEVPNNSESGGNGWIDQPAELSYNGWGVTSTHHALPVPLGHNISPQPQIDNQMPGIGIINPTAPPLPVDSFDEASIHYPSVDISPIEQSLPVAEQGSTSIKNDDGGSASCIICWEAPVQGACVPCGHMAGCMSCLNRIKSKKGDCPVCRTKINQVIRLYAV